MLKPLNYCRELIAQHPKTGAARYSFQSEFLSKVTTAQKFVLPAGGRFLDDPEYRALDELQELRLPYPVIALEYGEDGTRKDAYPELVAMHVDRRIVIASEVDGWIRVQPAFVEKGTDVWTIMPCCELPKTGFVRRDVGQRGGRVPVFFRTCEWDLPMVIPHIDFLDEVIALLSFLNTLSCSNVALETTKASPLKQSIARDRGALPYDAYHVLTLDRPQSASRASRGGSHRSPREHLRRGHIRRLDDGRRIWVNATIVSSGAAGAVRKEYGFRSTAVA